MNIDFMPVGDINMAVEWESSRILQEANGDRTKAHHLVLAQLVKQEIISDDELRQLSQIIEVGSEVDREETTAERAYIEARRVHYELLRSRSASPVALVLASTAAASYVSIDDSGEEPKVVFAKASASWEQIGGAIGAGIGGALGGGAGAVLGGAIGAGVGKAVDKCTED